MDDWKGKLLFKEKCPVCQQPISAYEDLEYGPNAYRYEEDTTMCDYGDRNGCFKTYHSKCFDIHGCPAHPSSKVVKGDTQ